MTRDFPDELIAKIIDYSESTAEVAVRRLVCKRWNHLAEPLMFGKEIVIRSDAGALSLYGHLCRKPHYGKLVKYVHFKERDIENVIREGLLRSAFTPNMEQMKGVLSFSYDFFKIMSAIANASTTPFDRLQAIPYPTYPCQSYDDALIAFKDTLRQIVLVLDANFDHENGTMINHLMDFKSLVNLTLKGDLTSVILLEEILQRCSTLEELTIQLHLRGHVHDKVFVEAWAAPIVNAVNSVKKVTIKDECRSDQLEYIRLKYPQIQTLVIDVQTPLLTEADNIKRMVEAMIGVPNFNIKLVIKEEHLIPALGCLLRAGCQFSVKEVDGNRFKIEMTSSSS
ncbi:hypothetical protein HMPREF1544_06250 [Mucor circinelloides 1006PhL]|uniref:F-box domain-containing protein n=1 Tax=Mucor circinelloides f. circinelloides (strain 1006PhL) TaxID=1220926 RepID=S2JEP8_MUCC1|nr:hypothetical protein HMPREF1544_06250 [Mucor circinelloides 1006PhL]